MALNEALTNILEVVGDAGGPEGHGGGSFGVPSWPRSRGGECWAKSGTPELIV